VVLAVGPEDGDRRHALLLADARRQPDGGDRLEQRVERAAEEACLLAGDDRDGLRVAQLSAAATAAGAALRRRCCAAMTSATASRCRGCRCARAIASRQAAGSAGLPL
jgi:hypothetical protein